MSAPHPIVVAKSTDGATTWTRTPLGDVGPAPRGIPAPTGSSGYPRMAVDPRTGALYVVYVGFNFGDLDTILQRSTDGGATWSPPLRVNDDPTGNGVRQLTPGVRRPQQPGGRHLDRHPDHPAERLLGRIGTYTWYGPAAAPLGDDAILFAWGDPRFSNVDTATDDIKLPPCSWASAGPAAIAELPKASPANLSVAASQLAYPGGSERIGAAFTSKLVVVHEDDVAGAMAGAVLARAHASPLLVTDGGSLTKEQREEIGRLNPTGMFVIGGEDRIPQRLVDEMTRSGVITQLSPPPTTTTVPAPATTSPAMATTATTLAPTPTADRADVIRLTGATSADLGGRRPRRAHRRGEGPVGPGLRWGAGREPGRRRGGGRPRAGGRIALPRAVRRP